MNTLKISILMFVLTANTLLSQGFINLNFESATITNVVFYEIAASNAFPSWTVTGGTLYNNFSLSGNSVSIFDTNNLMALQPMQGNYFAFLNSGNYPGTGIPISLAQTGTVPVSATSILFWGVIGGMQISFNGQPLSFSVLSSTPNYSVYGADISPYAGQTGNLVFTLPPYTGNASLDNIQFSTSPVPEPGALALAAMGALLLGWRRWKTPRERPRR